MFCRLLDRPLGRGRSQDKGFSIFMFKYGFAAPEEGDTSEQKSCQKPDTNSCDEHRESFDEIAFRDLAVHQHVGG